MAYQYADIIIDISHEKVDRPFPVPDSDAAGGGDYGGTCVTVLFGKGNSLPDRICSGNGKYGGV